MKIRVVEDDDAEKARLRLASELGIPFSELRCIEQGDKRFSFEVLTCPAEVEISISPDKMKAHWTHLIFPIGEKAPRLTPEFLIRAFEKRGVKAGIKKDVIQMQLQRVLASHNADEQILLNVLVAEGIEPVASKTGRPKLVFDAKLLEKNVPIYVKKGEILARAPLAEKGQDGFKVDGEAIPAPVEDQFKLNLGQGIEIQRTPTETQYVAKTFGRLYFDQGVRLRVECKVLDLAEGMQAAMEIVPKTFAGASITAKDLLDAARDQLVVFGFLSEQEISEQMRSIRKWPAQIIVAKGEPESHGAPGDVDFVFRKAMSEKPMDVLKIKSRIVFPGEFLATLKPPIEPRNGQTVFGEVLRGKVYTEMPIYPGKNVTREKQGEDIIFKSGIYGKVVVDKDRISVENPLNISADKMEAWIELYPQAHLSFSDVSNLLRDRDIMFGFEKDSLERELERAHQAQVRVEKFVIARGKLPISGIDARITFHFDKDIGKKGGGLFQKKEERTIFVAPGDLIVTKILAVDAQDGMDIYREPIPVKQANEAKDIPLTTGEFITETEIGRAGDEVDPLRLEFRAGILGTLVFKEKFIDVKPTLSVDKEEKLAQLLLAAKSDLGTLVTFDLVQKIAEKEGIRVPLEKADIEKALRMARPSNGGLHLITIAKAIDVKHGVNASIQYFVEYNGKQMVSFLDAPTKDEAPIYCDCVRPKDILAVKTPATPGQDGKTIFGRKIPANKGRDEPWRSGAGTNRTDDGLQLVCSLSTPGFVVVEQGKITVRNNVRIASDKMSVTASVYPTKNPRFQAREDKLISMILGAGVKAGLKKEAVRDAITECNESGKPQIDVLVAEGKKPTRGKDASLVFAIDIGDSVGEVRQDGSIDFKARVVFQNVRKGQLLLVKHPAATGQDGYDIFGNVLPSLMGSDIRMDVGEGVEKSQNGLEIRSSRDGIVEVLEKSIRVIPGLFVPEDVGLKTGNIAAGATKVIIKGSVMPDFQVNGEKEIIVEKVAEACRIHGKEDVKIKGGIIGRNKGFIYAGGNLEAFYIASGATAEAEGDVHVGSEVLNSTVKTAGFLYCEAGAGTICGGEIWTFKGLKAKTVGALGSETQTVIRLGEHFSLLRKAEERIAEVGIDKEIADLDAKVKELSRDLNKIYEELPQATKTDLVRGQKLQEDYRNVFAKRREIQHQIEQLQVQRKAIIDEVPINKDVSMIVTELIHPGVTIIYKDVIWVLKEPLRGVEIRWNSATSNLVSRRL